MISSRTPGGPPARCPVCGALCRSDPSQPSEDVPCPECGSLLWLAPEAQQSEAAYVHSYRFPLGDPFHSWVGGVSGRLGCPTPQVREFLERIETRDQARLLKKLSRDARSWADLVEQWNLVSGA
jgi:hypothetical protein